MRRLQPTIPPRTPTRQPSMTSPSSMTFPSHPFAEQFISPRPGHDRHHTSSSNVSSPGIPSIDTSLGPIGMDRSYSFASGSLGTDRSYSFASTSPSSTHFGGGGGGPYTPSKRTTGNHDRFMPSPSTHKTPMNSAILHHARSSPELRMNVDSPAKLLWSGSRRDV